MNQYEDKANRRQVWEHRFYFKENGGYYMKVYYKPKNRFWKIMHKLGLIKTQVPIAEIENSPMDWQYLYVEIVDGLKVKSIFSTTNGIKTFRISIPNETANKYEAIISFERLYS